MAEKQSVEELEVKWTAEATDIGVTWKE
jgi:hypothetical protein